MKKQDTSTLLYEYHELNEARKTMLRTEFEQDHGYKSHDSFYKKLRGESEIYINEKKWFAEKLNTTVEVLFP